MNTCIFNRSTLFGGTRTAPSVACPVIAATEAHNSLDCAELPFDSANAAECSTYRLCRPLLGPVVMPGGVVLPAVVFHGGWVAALAVAGALRGFEQMIDFGGGCGGVLHVMHGVRSCKYFVFLVYLM